MTAPLLASLAVVIALCPWALGLRRPARRLEGRRPHPSSAIAVGPLARRLFKQGVDGIDRRFRRGDDPIARWIASLDRTARAVSTGSSLPAALDTEGSRPDAPPPLAELVRLRRGGRSLPEATSALTPIDDPDGRLAVAVIGVLAGSGGPAAGPLDRAAEILRDRRAAAGERAIGAAQARLSAQVLSALPGVVTLWSLATDERLRHVLLRTPVGPACLAVGAALDLAGWRWMRRIVERS